MTQPHILIHEMTFNLPTGHTLFNKLNLSIAKHKIGLVGKNGIGKSTLIQLIAGDLQPLAGAIQIEGTLAYVDQNPFYPTDATVAGILGYEAKLSALQRIEQGSCDPHDFSILNGDWTVKEGLLKALNSFGLGAISDDFQVNMLSGGELTRLLLIKAFSTNADFLLLDEPTNHLDRHARKQLYDTIQTWQGGLIIASHDRTLLNLMDEIIEISSLGVSNFGGNYDAYQAQKECLNGARQNQYSEAKHSLDKTKRSIQLTKEKHSERQAQGRVLRKRKDQPKILLDAMENRSTASLGSLTIRHRKMLDLAQEKLNSAKAQLELIDEIHVALPKTYVPNGKVILAIENLSFAYSKEIKPLIDNFSLTIKGSERIALAGNNGSGKTTLIQLILSRMNGNQRYGISRLKPTKGKIYFGTERVNYLDQNTNQLNPDLSILGNFMLLNDDTKENDAYQALAQFLFKNAAAHKLVKHLSGGERLRALLACTLMSKHPPQLLILDEPTNHLDIHSLMSIESALKNYQGAMIVISHDQAFLDSIGIEKNIYAPFR